jgi:hypothetical protein
MLRSSYKVADHRTNSTFADFHRFQHTVLAPRCSNVLMCFHSPSNQGECDRLLSCLTITMSSTTSICFILVRSPSVDCAMRLRQGLLAMATCRSFLHLFHSGIALFSDVTCKYRMVEKKKNRTMIPYKRLERMPLLQTLMVAHKIIKI